ncbi:alcohol dehydrogenase catalytic domain-containing protein [Nocardia lijiangensis]|uniref:alcohol dehydrogenase catalytic domain-containing protein n=1 Tax=Nocardia lijiangensis TaxID=299618 RepID=UPI003D70A676
MSTPTFRAAVVRTPGGPDSIEIIDVPRTEPGPGEVRVAVAAAPVNPTDLGVVGGFFHELGMIDQPDHTGLGWDFAGTVLAAGPGVDLAVGTRSPVSSSASTAISAPMPNNSSCPPPISPWCPTGSTWSRHRRCRSTGWVRRRSSTCSATRPPTAAGCW